MKSRMEQKLAELRIIFIAEFNHKLSVLITLWSEAKKTQSLVAIKQFRFEVHSLKGSSGALNFLALSDRLNIIEAEVIFCEEQTKSLKSVIPFVERHLNSMIEVSSNDPNPLLVLKDIASS